MDVTVKLDSSECNVVKLCRWRCGSRDGEGDRAVERQLGGKCELTHLFVLVFRGELDNNFRM